MDFIEAFLEASLTERGLAKNSVLAYKRDLLDFKDFLAEKSLGEKEVSTEDLRNFIIFLSKKGVGARSVNRKLSTVKSYYDFLLTEKENIKHNPANYLDLPKFESKLPFFLSLGSIVTLLEYCKKDPSPEGLRLSAAIHLLYSGGFRVSELISLKISDLISRAEKNSPVKKVFTVTGKGSKERIVIINDQAAEAVEKYLPVRPIFFDEKNKKSETYLFPSYSAQGYLTRQNFALLLKRAALEAGLDHKNISPHALRHSFATHLIEGGADINALRELLGHADISTTQIYAHLQKSGLKSAVEKFHPLSGKKA